ncbi:ketopantoate hydroxymethyltransferase-domain-containing protein [Phlyctochytrium arcticum]|nr:ketopantoate hydroxymethyltransferase-domain-containing protein [Phlyctochytrium arcticum]
MSTSTVRVANMLRSAISRRTGQQHFANGHRGYSSYPGPEELPKSARKKVTLNTVSRLYARGEPIAVMTAHDYPSACFADKSGNELLLVGDSLAMVALGYENTNQVTLDEMLHHCRAVARGAKHSFLIGDLPFGSYEASPTQALKSSIRMISEGRMEAVKFEGGAEMFDTMSKITSVGIPVLAHIGLTPQRASSLGGFRVQGKTADKAKLLMDDALAVQKAGAFAVVLEAVPDVVAAEVTKRLSIPTIGIGAGPGCSGQVLVQMDTLGMYEKLAPKFNRVYAEVGKASVDGLEMYVRDVKSRAFPESGTHTYPMAKGEEVKFLEWIQSIPVRT